MPLTLGARLSPQPSSSQGRQEKCGFGAISILASGVDCWSVTRLVIDGTRKWNSTSSPIASAQNAGEFADGIDLGRENRALGRFGENVHEIANLKLAERVGVLARDFRKPNVYSGLQLISRNHNNLASSNFCRRFRPFAGFCRFFYFNDTRNGTRREILVRIPRGSFIFILRLYVATLCSRGMCDLAVAERFPFQPR